LSLSNGRRRCSPSLPALRARWSAGATRRSIRSGPWRAPGLGARVIYTPRAYERLRRRDSTHSEASRARPPMVGLISRSRLGQKGHAPPTFTPFALHILVFYTRPIPSTVSVCSCGRPTTHSRIVREPTQE
jgi:hypothetical protein